MESNSDVPGHYRGPDGSIYAMVSKSPKEQAYHHQELKNHPRIHNGNTRRNVTTSKTTSESKSSRRKEEAEQKSNIVENVAEVINKTNRKHNNNKNINFSSSCIYESLDEFDHLQPPAPPGGNETKMSSEEEERLQNLLSDLLGMADDLCGSLGRATVQIPEGMNSPPAPKTVETVKRDVNDHEQRRSQTLSSYSGFYQQLPSELEHPTPSNVLPTPLPILISSTMTGVYFNLDQPQSLRNISEATITTHLPDQKRSLRDFMVEFHHPGTSDTFSGKLKNIHVESTPDFPAPENIYSLVQESSDNSIKTPDELKRISKINTGFIATGNLDRTDLIDPLKYQMNFALNDLPACIVGPSEATPPARTPYFDFDGLSVDSQLNRSNQLQSLLFNFHTESPLTPMTLTPHNDPILYDLVGPTSHVGVEDDLSSIMTETMGLEASESIDSLLLDVPTPFAERLAIKLGCSRADMERRRRNWKQSREEETVSLQPIGAGMQVLEPGRQTANHLPDNLSSHSTLTSRSNNFYDSNISFYPNNHSPDMSSVNRHAPLVKSVSSGYHGQRPCPTTFLSDTPHYSPQPIRNEGGLRFQRTNPTSCQYLHGSGYQNEISSPTINFQGTPRFRPNSNNNVKLPQRFKQKYNNNHSNDINNFNNYNNNNYNDNYNNNNSEGRFSFPRSPLNQSPQMFLPQEATPYRSLQFSRPPLSTSHSLGFSGSDSPQPGMESTGVTCSTMPRRMKLLNPRYHQISEPQLFRDFQIDSSMNPLEVVTTPCFVTDQSKRWYHPTMSREQAIKLLVNKPAGSFIIRNSNSFEGAYGLVMKVDKLPSPPMNVSPHEYVRHFLIESTSSGVRVRGSPVEPTFGSLSALVYQHMLTPLSLPCTLVLNRFDGAFDMNSDDVKEEISPQPMEETFYYVNGGSTEGLTGAVAMEKVIKKTFNSMCVSEFKVTKTKLRMDQEGITLTDLERRLFFRKKYPWNSISYSGIDNSTKVYFARGDDSLKIFLGRLFCIVARGSPTSTENTCHILASVKPNDQSFINTVEAINDRIQMNC